jgi:hypothetical protein
MYQKEELPNVYEYASSDGRTSSAIYGTIEGWGVVVEGESGFRCEFARITSLFDPTSVPSTIVSHHELANLKAIVNMSECYEVPIVPFRQKEVKT